MIAAIIHALLVAGDNLDKVADELPAPICTDAQIMLTALARAAQLTAEQLKAEETGAGSQIAGGCVMSGQAFETRIAVANCGCGGRGIIWDRPSDYGDGTGTVEAFCSRHCGIHVSCHAYGIDRPYRRIGLKVVRTWNRAMSGVKHG